MARDTYIFGKRVRQARDRTFQSQAELGARLNPPMSDENISRIEGSEVAGIRSKQIPNLARALNMTLDEFARIIIAPAGARPTRKYEQIRVTPQVMARLRAAAASDGTTPERKAEQILDAVLPPLAAAANPL